VHEAREEAALCRRRSADLEITIVKLTDVLDRRDVETEALNAQIRDLENDVSAKAEEAERCGALVDDLAKKVEANEAKEVELRDMMERVEAERAEASERLQMLEAELAREKKLRSAASEAKENERKEKQAKEKEKQTKEKENAKKTTTVTTVTTVPLRSVGCDVGTTPEPDVSSVNCQTDPIQKRNWGTDPPHSHKCTQTKPESPSSEPVAVTCVAEAARAAHMAFLRFAELTQREPHSYEPAFKGHLPNTRFAVPLESHYRMLSSRPVDLNGLH
jgi:chemotaxis protein histidine kinase CheA